ncbi:MAG: AmmeMemoRadiSam system protein A [bacterium]|nr:AmmeMemoRadiSam system protein A [bacterium]
MKNDETKFDKTKNSAGEKPVLSASAKQELLKLARETITSYLRSHRLPKLEIPDPELNQNLGAFVTLTIQGQLRGCIGRFEPDMPIAEVVQQMAVAAATEDPRFSPVTLAELQKIRIEISALTPRRKITDITEIQVGKHGLYLTRGWHSGTLLPQVATEYHWTREEFLQHTCYKAGLPPDAWKDKDTELFVYSAEIFHEVN